MPEWYFVAMANERLWPRDLPPVWLRGSLLAMVALHVWLPGPRWLWPPWTWGGLAFVVSGGWLTLGSALRFRRVGTGVRPFSAASSLVRGGAYRWTRNPMYLGMVAFLVGIAGCLGTTTTVLVPVAFWVLLDRRFVRREEAFLRARFGADYDAWCREVRRWL